MKKILIVMLLIPLWVCMAIEGIIETIWYFTVTMKRGGLK